MARAADFVSIVAVGIDPRAGSHGNATVTGSYVSAQQCLRYFPNHLQAYDASHHRSYRNDECIERRVVRHLVFHPRHGWSLTSNVQRRDRLGAAIGALPNTSPFVMVAKRSLAMLSTAPQRAVGLIVYVAMRAHRLFHAGL